MKACVEVEFSSKNFLRRHLIEVSGHLHAPTDLISGECVPRYPLNRRFGRPQCVPERKEENYFLLLPSNVKHKKNTHTKKVYLINFN
jgi:hypothetical protein